MSGGVAESRGRRATREIGILLVIGLVAAGGAYLVRANMDLRQQNDRLMRLVEPHPGVYVPELPVTSLRGDSVVLGKIGQRQLLFFFNTTCPHCQTSVSEWNKIADALKRDSMLTVLGVAFDEPGPVAAYARQQNLRFRVAAKPDPRLAGLYRISGVPAIILVDDAGRMAYTRLGPLQSPLAVDSILAAVRAVEKATRERP